jgi:hypothetical protein
LSFGALGSPARDVPEQMLGSSVAQESNERSQSMNIIKHSAIALVLIGGAAVSTPTFAVEPDVDSPAGPELPAPRTDRPDYQQDDQPGAAINPEDEGADPNSGPAVPEE